MSGLLERMAKRAHGTLDGVQPLIAPKFAPAARAGRDPLAKLPRPLAMRAALPGEDGVEREFTEAPMELRQEDVPVAATRRPAARVGKRSGSKLPIDADERSRDVPGAEAAAGHPVAESMTDPESRELRRGAVAARAPGDVGHGLQRAVSGPKIEGPVRGAGDSAVAADAGEDSDAGAAIAQQSDRRTVFADSPPPTHRRGEADDSTTDWADAQPGRAIAQRAAGAHATRVGDQRERIAEPEEKAEIHISIGNIELRAARAETRPQPAPFRPRVTLEEFLRRKTEAQR
jgi:hypothetical protein